MWRSPSFAGACRSPSHLEAIGPRFRQEEVPGAHRWVPSAKRSIGAPGRNRAHTSSRNSLQSSTAVLQRRDSRPSRRRRCRGYRKQTPGPRSEPRGATFAADPEPRSRADQAGKDRCPMEPLAAGKRCKSRWKAASIRQAPASRFLRASKETVVERERSRRSCPPDRSLAGADCLSGAHGPRTPTPPCGDAVDVGGPFLVYPLHPYSGFAHVSGQHPLHLTSEI